MVDIEQVDKILNSVLGLIHLKNNEQEIVYVPVPYSNKVKDSSTPKGQEDLIEAVGRINNKIEQLQAVQSDVSVKINELHAVKTGYNFKPKDKKPTKKQLQEEEDLKAREFAHQKALNS